MVMNWISTIVFMTAGFNQGGVETIIRFLLYHGSEVINGRNPNTTWVAHAQVLRGIIHNAR